MTCCEVSIRDLIEHVIAGNEFAVRLLAGASADEARAGIDKIQLHADPARQVSDSCAAQAQAFDAADQSLLLHHPSGDIDHDTFVRLRLGELIVHGWDIAAAAGLDTTIEPPVAEDLWHRVEPHLAEMQAMGAYGTGPRVDPPPDAPTQDRLLHSFGRDPR